MSHVPTNDEAPRGVPSGQLRRIRRAAITIAVLLVLLVGSRMGADAYTRWLWFDSMGYSSVLRNQWLTQLILFTVGALVAALAVWSSLHIAYRHRPLALPTSKDDFVMEGYRGAIDPLRRKLWVIVPIVIGFFAGIGLAGQWKTALLWWNSQSFGRKDAHFGKDIGFFVFTVPWLQLLVSFFTIVTLLALAAALVAHYLYGGLSFRSVPGSQGDHTTRAARIHLATVAAVLLLVRAGGYWVSRYSEAYAPGSRITGITYTSDHAIIPTRAMLAVAALCCAGMFIFTIVTGRWRVPLIGVATISVMSLLVGAIYPAIVQRFQVKPSESSKEASYIRTAMLATQDAYNINGIERQQYSGKPDTSGAKSNQTQTQLASVKGIRQLDPMVVSPTFQQLQGQTNYYQFPQSLDVDRYTTISGPTDVVVAARGLDLSGVPANQRNWVNDHTVYTHGYGLVAAQGAETESNGTPKFIERDMPSVGDLGKYEPRIYFGEGMPGFAIVGGQGQRELDYPTDSGGGQARTRYAGKGGVALNSSFRKLAYALSYGDKNFVLSDAIDARSRVIEGRDPATRVRAVAPWLKTDGDVYPSIVDGRIQWIVDGYTTSSSYPGSAMSQLDSATSDSATAAANNRQTQGGDINYIRNSVKATVDAYTGEVKLYAWEPNDPVLKAWRAAFGGTVRPMSQMSAELIQHVRYPSDMFKVQRTVLEKYHQRDAASFFSASGQWQVPNDPTGRAGTQQPPYYLTMAMPGQNNASYSLTSTYIPVGSKQNIVGYLAADSDAGSAAGKKSSNYGKLRLLETTGSTSVMGPGQFQSRLESTTATEHGGAQPLNQLLLQAKQNGSLDRGNLLTLPFSGGFLYVEPIYLRAQGGSAYPEQRAVVVGFGDKLVWARSLQDALGQLTQDMEASTQPAKPSTPSAKSDGKKVETAGSPEVKEALGRASQAYEDGQSALKRNDWKAYGEAQDRLKKALDDADAAAAG